MLAGRQVRCHGEDGWNEFWTLTDKAVAGLLKETLPQLQVHISEEPSHQTTS